MKLRRDPNCERCRLFKTADYVCILGTGPTPCDIAIIGEAPKQDEEEAGEHFVGFSGDILEDLLEDTDIELSEVFLTNAVSCRTPTDKAPSKGDRQKCKYWLDYQLDKVKPKFVLLLGNTAVKSVLGEDTPGITQVRGKPIEEDGVTYLATFSPASVLHDPKKKSVISADLRLFSDIINSGGVNTEKDFNPIEVKDKATFKRLLKALKGTVSWDLETSDLYAYHKIAHKNKHLYEKSVITAIGFGTKDAQWSIPINHYEYSPFTKKQLKKMIAQIGERLKNCMTVGHNGKFDQLWMFILFGVDWPLDFDTMLAHYSINENSRHDLEYLSQIFYGAFPYGIKPELAPWEKLWPYHCKDLYYTRKLRFTLGKLLKKDPSSARVFKHITMPASRFFLDAQKDGVYVNTSGMGKAERQLRRQVKRSEKKLKKYGPKDMNWGSPAQVSDYLFGQEKGQLGLDWKKETSRGSGKPSSDKSVLKQIDHPSVEALLALRGAKQQLSLFIEGWKPLLVDSYLHPSWKIHGTVTGRPSCSDPNLQQVDRRGRIRNLISAPDGWQLVEVDLSQIELRVAAELANERAMLETFYSGEDIHWKTAIREISRVAGEAELVKSTGKKLLGIRRGSITYGEAIQAILKAGPKACQKIDARWKDLRYGAKAVNFGFLYGMVSNTFRIYARDTFDLKISQKQAMESRDNFFETYPDLFPWFQRQRKYAMLNGYVKTMTGRKRRLPEAQSHHDTPQRAAAQRMAINSPVQGFAGELNLMAGMQARSEFSRHDVRIPGTIHDAVLFLIRNAMVPIVVPRVLEIMKRPAMLDTLGIVINVPLEAEASIGPWGAGISLEEYLDKVA